jgi:hypothetical protein
LLAGGGTAAVAVTSSSTAPPSATSSTCAPQNVANLAGDSDASVSVTWDAPPANCGPVTQFQIKVLSPSNGQDVVATAPGNATSINLTEPVLRLCTKYKLGVVAVRGSAQSPAAAPAQAAFTYGAPYNASNLVTIVLQGVNSHIGGGSYDPYATSDCTSKSGSFALDDFTNEPKPLYDMIFGWMNLDSNTPKVDIGAGNNLIDSVASIGGLVLPFSYNGATLSGNTYTVNAYTADTVASSNPETTVAYQLWDLVTKWLFLNRRLGW